MIKRLLIAAAFLLASAPLYAQQISVDRTRYCNDLSKWTSVARAQVTARNDAKSMDPYKCGPIPAPPPVPVNCVVSAWSAFSAWTPLNATTEQRTQTRTVVTPASNGGTACPSLTNTETRPIVVVPETVGPQATLPTLPATTVTVVSGASLQAAVDAHPAGTSYLLKAGTYSNQTVTPKDGDTYTGEVGTILTGLDTTLKAFTGHAAGVTVQNMVIEHYVSPDSGAVDVDGLNFTLRHVELRKNKYSGLAQNTGATAQWNFLHDNGAFGVIGAGGNILFERNECSLNNTSLAYDPYNGAGCSKWVFTNGLIVRNNYSHDNGGPGFWTDISNSNTLYEGNTVSGNWRMGIFHEISYSAVIRNNTILNNGKDKGYPGWDEGACIAIVTSSGVEAYGNVCTDNWQGIVLLEDARGGVDPASQTNGNWTTTNAFIHDNTINSLTDLGPGSGNSGVLNVGALNPYSAAANNRFVHNTYSLGPHTAYFYWSGIAGTVASWQAVGQDTTGTFTTTAPVPVPPPSSGAFYISPFGSDTNAGTLAAPFKTFAKAFTAVKSSGELVILDGTYTAATTGLLSDMPNAIIPNGTAAAHTRIHALNFGKVFQMGSLWLGRSTVKRSYVDIEGIVFDGGTAGPGVTLYNTSFDTLRQVGSHGSPNNDGAAAFDVGTNDGEWGNTDNLIEDSFGWGNARAIADNYYEANRNTWRRVFLRRDGCKIGDGNNGCSTDPNITFTVYDSQNVTVENMIILDGILIDSRTGYADFATAQHDPGPKNGGNKWLGTLSLGSPDHSYYFESDGTGPQPEVTAQDVIGWASKENMALQPSGGLVANRITTTDASPDFIGSSVTKSSVVVNASPTNHVGGASLLFRYQNGVLTQTPLWPWPNESVIQSVMCVGTSVRGFCFDTLGLTHYIWSKLSSQSLPY